MLCLGKIMELKLYAVSEQRVFCPYVLAALLSLVLVMFGPYLLVVFLQAHHLLSQGLKLGFQVSSAQSEVIQNSAKASDVRLIPLTKTELIIIPSET